MLRGRAIDDDSGLICTGSQGGALIYDHLAEDVDGARVYDLSGIGYGGQVFVVTNTGIIAIAVEASDVQASVLLNVDLASNIDDIR